MTTALEIPKLPGLPPTHSILIAGIGNVFLGDDGFGVAVARRLATHALSDGVRVEDFGIRGFDLAFALAGSGDTAILVDATRRGEPPGTLYVLELDLGLPAADAIDLDTHGMNPANVLRLVTALGGRSGRVFLVGCEPSDADADGGDLPGLSRPVESAIDGAIELVETLVARIREGG